MNQWKTGCVYSVAETCRQKAAWLICVNMGNSSINMEPSFLGSSMKGRNLVESQHMAVMRGISWQW